MNDFLQQDWLIIANGPILPLELLTELQLDKKTIALDGAIISCIERNIVPDIVLGDFDSVDRDLIDNIEFVLIPDQDSTDLEKGIDFALNLQPKSITICQAIGARLDHSLHNLRILKRVYPQIKKITIFTETEKIYYIKNKNIVIVADNIEPLALLSFPKAIVSSKGLKYDMQELKLEFAKQESTSNHLIHPSARISINGEVLLIISHQTELIFT